MRSTREQRGWYFYDWAAHGYVTVTVTVLFGPYLTSIANRAAGCVGSGICDRRLTILGIPIAPGSLFFYTVTFSTLLSALLLPAIGALADRRGDRRRLLGRFAWIGSLAAGLMVFVSGTNWVLGALLLVIGNVALGASLVVYSAILIDIAPPDERDRVSSRGWSRGYAGGGLLLVASLLLVLRPSLLGIDTSTAVRVSLLAAGLWWGLWTIIPYRVLHDGPRHPSGHSTVRATVSQLATSLRDLRMYPQTGRFLAAYLFYNDGVQTVISAASVFGAEQLGFSTSSLVGAIVIVQVVAFAGALLLGRRAGRRGAHRTIRDSLLLWVVAVGAGYFLPAHKLAPFLGLAVALGLVLGGTQALSRSLFSQLVPRGREAEYFSLYQACERGTSWLGTLVFGLVHQLTGSYRPAILSLVVFFVVGGLLLRRVDVRRGIVDAGNVVPNVV